MVSLLMEALRLTLMATHRQTQSTLIHTMETLTICNHNSRYEHFSYLVSRQLQDFFSYFVFNSLFHSHQLLHNNQLQLKHTIRLHIQQHHLQMPSTLVNTWSTLAFKILLVCKSIQDRLSRRRTLPGGRFETHRLSGKLKR